MKWKAAAILLLAGLVCMSGCGNPETLSRDGEETAMTEEAAVTEETAKTEEDVTEEAEGTAEEQENGGEPDGLGENGTQNSGEALAETGTGNSGDTDPQTEQRAGRTEDSVTEGMEEYRGFVLDNVLHSEEQGDIHFNLYVPDSYDGSRPVAVFFTLPGYEGLYFQGVGENLYSEEFGFQAQAYDPEMIVVAPQLSDWGETSADQTIALVEYFLSNYNIDPSRVYAEGYSGGGETLSLVMGKRSELFTAYLQCSSQWDGEYDAVAENRTPVYFVVGESDEYYGSEPSEEAYQNLYQRYQEEGLSEEEIQDILVLDVKDAAYFESRGVSVQHGGGNLFAQDEEIMGWLFGK